MLIRRIGNYVEELFKGFAMESSKRLFTSGSRQAPDPYDQFLEREGYYRKHVARDATCLFRTFSEQVFDVQMYHGKVRNDCIRWMRKKSNEYTKKISGDFDDYLTEMSKLRSYGSFVELHALAHAYRFGLRNFVRECVQASGCYVLCRAYVA